jgi:hypothetical protein
MFTFWTLMGQFRARTFASAPVPTVDRPRANTCDRVSIERSRLVVVVERDMSILTGNPEDFSSAKSLTLPPTTQPATPLIFILFAIIPPIAAQL